MDGWDARYEDLLKHELTAADLRALAGLSYRQLNEWEKRGFLQSSRTGKGKWRRFNALQVIMLRVMSDIHGSFGTPLARQGKLLKWMTGRRPSRVERRQLDAVERCLLGLAPGRELGLQEIISAMSNNGSSPPSFGDLTPDATSPTATTSAGNGQERSCQQVVRARSAGLALVLARRKWDERIALTFSESLLSLTYGASDGIDPAVDVSDELRVLYDMAVSSGDEGVAYALWALIAPTLLPLIGCMELMRRGFAVHLVTDLDESRFVAEPGLAEMLSSGQLPDEGLVLLVSSSFNAVFEAVGCDPYPVSKRVADANPDRSRHAAGAVREIAALARERGFDRVVVEATGGRVMWERAITRDDTNEVVREMLESIGSEATGRAGVSVSVDNSSRPSVFRVTRWTSDPPEATPRAEETATSES